MTQATSGTEETKPTSITLVRVTCDDSKDPSPILREGITDLFKLYFDELFELGCDLGFQGFQNEWIDLPGKYDFDKRGGIFAAVEVAATTTTAATATTATATVNAESLKNLLVKKEQIVGCICLRPLTESCGELKRMYVRKTHRQTGVGKLLAKEVIDHAWEGCQYDELKLDSLERLQGAVSLYSGLGFSRISPYCECPEEDHVCMNKFRF